MTRGIVLFTFAPVVALASLAGMAAANAGMLLVNESPSLPRGLYWRTAEVAPRIGDVVALEPPAPARAYLSTLGMPASVKLLKRVAAHEGDEVCAGAATVRLPTRELAVRGADRRGAALPRWTGCRALGAGEVFVVGDSAVSFDSRYFGPVAQTAVAGVYQEILTW